MTAFYNAPPDLLRACVWIFLFGWLITSLNLPLRWSAALAAIKVAIPFFYFASNPSGHMHLSDDIAYFLRSMTFLKMGFEPASVIFDPGGLPLVMDLAETRQHIAYPLWNLFGTFLFGPHYFSPVLLNVGVTFVSGWFFFRILRALDFSLDYSRFGLAFFLLHWDILAWSSFLNLKESLVTMVSLALLHQIILLLNKSQYWRVFPILILSAGCYYLRFYVPILLGAAVALHLFLRVKNVWARLVMGALLGLELWAVAQSENFVWVRISEIFWGLPQILFTPLPWNLSEGYEFLLVSSALNLLLIVPVLFLLPSLWKRNPQSRLLLLYLFVVLAAFAVVPSNRGIRQRQMVGFVFIWMQFHVLCLAWNYLVESLSRPAPGSGLPQADPVKS